jgi:small conductance mechanosensitive channel
MIHVDPALLSMVQEHAVEWSLLTLKVAALVIVGWFFASFIASKVNSVISKFRLEEAVIQLIQTIVHITLKISFVVFALNQAGIKMTIVAAVLGGLSISLGLALKNNISQVANGILLIVNKPFKIGDYIECGSVAGTVESIGLFNATLVTPQNQKVVAPNSQLATSSLTNFSAHETRRIDLVFGLGYNDSMKDAIPVLKEAVSKVEGVLPEQPVDIYLTDFGDSSINMSIRAWCLRTDFLAVRHTIIATLHDVCNEKGFSIPFPQMDVHVQKDS